MIHDYMDRRAFFKWLQTEIVEHFEHPVTILDLGCGDLSPILVTNTSSVGSTMPKTVTLSFRLMRKRFLFVESDPVRPDEWEGLATKLTSQLTIRGICLYDVTFSFLHSQLIGAGYIYSVCHVTR